MQGLGSGAHSHVWKVKIDNRIYALKMFRHIRAEEENAASPARLERFGVDLQLLNNQLTPFNCEARAYGRLIETGNVHIAWECYGYIALDEATYSSVVWDRIGLPRKEWFFQTSTDAEVADRPVFPIYALVKEFIPDASRLGAIDISKAHDMAQHINKLHSIGITHRDIQDRNFVDSRIMDFSTSWTVPNIRLDRQLKWDPKDMIDQADTNDYFMFDDMIEMWNNEHPDSAPSNYRMTSGDKYRPRQGVKPGAATRPEKRNSSSSTSSGSSSNASSDDMEEIPILERIRDNRYLVLASSYDWVAGKPAVAQPEVIAPPTPGPGGNSDSGDGVQGPSETPGSPRPYTPWSSPLGFSVPDYAIAGFNLPGVPIPGSPTTRPPTPGPREGDSAANDQPQRRSREARKLEAVREAAGRISAACDDLKAMARDIIDIIDDDHYEGGKVPPGTGQQTFQPSGGRRRRREDDGVDRSARPARRRRR